MTISKAQQKAVTKYKKTHYDQVLILLPKGQKEIIEQYAKSKGQSVNSVILQILKENIEGLK